jgi:nicotinamide-nucleotide amidase
MQCTIITIGDEILIGQIVDTNSAWIGQTLNAHGIKVHEILSVGDDASQIIDALHTAASHSQLVLITGGLGPTKDDITKHTLCHYFGVEEIHHEETFERLRAIFEKRGKDLLELNSKQAMLPSNCTALLNERGTAPGMWFEHEGVVYISMPGVPMEMKYMLTHQAMPRISERFVLPKVEHRYLMTVGMGESSIALLIKDIELDLPKHIKLAYLPDIGRVRLRLSVYGVTDPSVINELIDYHQQIKTRLGELVYAEEDILLEDYIGRLFLQQGKKFALAESCTGGYAGHLVTSIGGSSRYFEGSTVTYSYDMKQAILGVNPATLAVQGAVSETCVSEMLTGLLRISSADYGAAISGIAGPDGGTADKPVGTVCIAVGNRDRIFTKTYQFFPSRMENIRASSIKALDLLRRLVLDYELK